MTKDFPASAANVRLMGFDVDGILTDGSLYYSAQGDEMKAFSTLDGHGIRMLMDSGIQVAIISGRSSKALELRAQNLGIDMLLQGVHDKRGAMAKLLAERNLDFAAAGYMGDDVVDLPVLRACGFSATAGDSHAFVKRHVQYAAAAPGGRGAVREVCEGILHAQGKLDGLLATYLA